MTEAPHKYPASAFPPHDDSHRVPADQLLTLLLEHTHDAIYILAGKRFPFVNRTFLGLFGVTPEEVNAEDFDFMTLVDPSSHPLLVDRARRIAAGQAVPQRYEFTALARDGRRIEVEATTERILFDGEPATIGIVRDISERKEAERRLQESQRLLRVVVDNAPIVLWALDADGTFTLSEGKGLSRLGLRSGEVLGRSAFEVYAGEPEVLDMLERAMAGETVSVTVPVGANQFETHTTPLRDPHGGVTGVLGVSFDVTEMEALRLQLYQSQKMEAVGRLAGGIAHDFNNILTVIAGNAELGMGGLMEGDPLHQRLENIQAASAHAQELTSRLLAFSRRQPSSPKVLDLTGTLQSMETMLHRIIGEHIRLETVYGPGVGPVRLDPGQIEQVVVNLVVNARDALPDGGTIWIRTGNQYVDEDYAQSRPYAQVGPHVSVEIQDDGVGMDEETLAHIYEPFFTTKPQGTGLGLSTVYGIVKQSGGMIEVESGSGKGTRFQLLFPLVDSEVPRASESTGTARLSPGGERVVLVEDEAPVREITHEILSSLGYDVTPFADAASALAYLSDDTKRVDLVITDVIMPVISGAEMVARLPERMSATPVLFMSGYTDDAIARHGVLDEGVNLITKPFTSGDLAHRIRSILDPPA